MMSPFLAYILMIAIGISGYFFSQVKLKSMQKKHWAHNSIYNLETGFHDLAKQTYDMIKRTTEMEETAPENITKGVLNNKEGNKDIVLIKNPEILNTKKENKTKKKPSAQHTKNPSKNNVVFYRAELDDVRKVAYELSRNHRKKKIVLDTGRVAYIKDLRGHPITTPDGAIISVSGGFSWVTLWRYNNKKMILKIPINFSPESMKYLIVRLQSFKKYIQKLPYFVNYEVIPNAIKIIDNSGYEKYIPAILEEYVRGVPLNKYICEKAKENNTERIRAVLQNIEIIRKSLKENSIAHGDLCGDNILVLDDGKNMNLKLIDYDSVWIPDLENVPPHSEGHMNYKLATYRKYGPDMDEDFFDIVTTALHVLVEQTSLWENCDDDEDHILFKKKDLIPNSPLLLKLSLLEYMFSDETVRCVETLRLKIISKNKHRK